METSILVYADWIFPHGEGLKQPFLVGKLTSSLVRNKESFSFSYAPEWLNSPYKLSIDPELQLFSGRQFSNENKIFRIFLDSCPDRWGRLLMKRREAVLAREEQRKLQVLNEVDYLLGVHDQYRMGGLRFKRDPSGPFLDNNDRLSAPPMSSLSELEHAVGQVEADHSKDKDYIKWLFMLMSPGSSLGGARPKASVINDDGSLWIAKFPSRFDEHDVGAWEYVIWQLALDAGINMAESRIMRFNHHHHTFLTKRFDRHKEKRLHFTSAMTQLGYYDGAYEASYLELADFLSYNGEQVQLDLEQLWRRIVFNIAVSNTDDHLRNHGFILTAAGWRLSPAYDLNPVTPAYGLHLNITDNDNSLDFELAMEVIDFFRIKPSLARKIRAEVESSVSKWSEKAADIGISKVERERMESAFLYG